MNLRNRNFPSTFGFRDQSRQQSGIESTGRTDMFFSPRVIWRKPERFRGMRKNGRSMMNSFLKSCTALTVALTFSGQAIAQVKELGKGEGQVNIVAWPGYIERGETDK